MFISNVFLSSSSLQNLIFPLTFYFPIFATFEGARGDLA